MKNNQREGIRQLTMVGEVSALVLVSLFAMLSLLLVGIGTKGYTAVTESALKISRARDSLSYVSGKFRVMDGSADVSVRPLPEGDALVFAFALEGEAYETRIFLADGWLCEQFAQADAPIDGELSERIVEVAGFTVEKTDLWRLTVTDPDGAVYEQYVAERSGEAILQ